MKRPTQKTGMASAYSDLRLPGSGSGRVESLVMRFGNFILALTTLLVAATPPIMAILTGSSFSNRAYRFEFVTYWFAGYVAYSFLLFPLKSLFPKAYDKDSLRLARTLVNITAVSLLVWLTGGIDSPFWPAYVVPLLESAFYFASFLETSLISVAMMVAYVVAMLVPFAISGGTFHSLNVARVIMQAGTLPVLGWILHHLVTLIKETGRSYRTGLNTIERLVKDLDTAPDLTTLCAEVIQRATESLTESGCFGALMLYDWDRQRLWVAARYPKPPGPSSFPEPEYKLGDGVAGRVAELKVSRLLVDAHEDPDYVISRRAVTSLLCVPIVSHGRCIGVINIDHPKAGRFMENDKELLETYAAIIADNVVTLQVLDRLHELKQRAFGTLRESLDGILAAVARVIPYDSAAIFLNDGGVARVQAARKHPHMDEALKVRMLIREDPIFSEAADTMRPVILENAANDPRFRRFGGTDYARGFMAAPLVAEGEIVGFLTIESCTENAYGPADAGLISLLTGYTAAAIREIQYAEQQDLMGRIIDQAPIGIAVIDESGHILHFNRDAQRITGYALDSALSIDAIDLLWTDAGRAEYSRLALDHTAITTFTSTVLRTRTGASVPVTLSAVALPGVGHLLMFDDKVENVRLQQELIRGFLEAASIMGTDIELRAALQRLLQHTQDTLQSLGVSAITLYPYDPQQGDFALPPIAVGQKEYAALEFPPADDSVVRAGLTQKEPIFVDSVVQHPFTAASALAKWGTIGSAAICSLRDGNRPLGVMFYNFANAHAFTKTERELIRTLTSVVSMVVAKATHYARLLRHVQEQESLAEAMRAVLDSRFAGIEQALGSLAEKAAHAADVNTAALFVYEEATHELVGLVGYGIGAEKVPGMRVPEDFSGTVKDALKTREAVVIADTSQDDRVPKTFVQEYGICASLTVPLIAHDHVIGFLFLDESRFPRRFTDAQIQLGQMFASEAALAIEDSRLYQAERQAARDLHLLTDLAHQIGSLSDRDELLRAVSSALFNYVRRPLRIGLLQERFLAYDSAGACGFPDPVPDCIRQPVDDSLGGLAVTTQKTQLVADLPSLLKSLEYVPSGAGSEIILPLSIGDDVQGVLGVYYPAGTDLSQELPMLELVASQLSVALKYQQVFESQAAHAKLEMLNDLGAFLTHRMSNIVGTIPHDIDDVARWLPAEAEEAHGALRDMKTAVAHLVMLADQIRYAANLGASGATSQTDMTCWLEDVAREPHFSNVRIETQFTPGLPLVRALPALLKDIFISVLKNADAAMQPQGGRLVLRTQASADGRFVEAFIRDFGRGLTPEERARLFNPFFSRRRTGPGLGVALWLSRLLLRSWGGDIDVISSEPGKGTELVIRLPVDRRQSDSSPAEPTGLQQQLDEPALTAPELPAESASGQCVALVVDDLENWRHLWQRRLTARGYVVRLADSYATAQPILGAQTLDLAILDIRLVDEQEGNRDGLRLAQQINARNPRALIILATGFDVPPEVAALEKQGIVHAILRKHQSPEECDRLLDRLMAARHAVTENGALPDQVDASHGARV